ncbi:MAG: DNA-directed RNA polymerase subunit alpha [Planctomycetes bacterium]|nr:DNA-directed RNA polymerase subunit alpha [Planctomycetota bacterium]MBI3836031.1 DNA-directed RNA polymerase subunit alpha [Planctomycetota bacterium]
MPTRMRWRGLELPSRVVRDESVSTDSYGRFTIEPFEQGFGTTIGNSLRRVLLSCLEGAAVTTVKIAGVSHEFTTIPGVLEDATDILLNTKGIVLRYSGDEDKKISVRREKSGEVRAGDIIADPAITIVNPTHKIATLTTDTSFQMEMTVATGRGYATVNDNRAPEQELDVIPIDSIFSPVLRVRYRTEATRVGQRTDYDRLIFEVWTKGTISPEDALVEAGLVLRKHLNPFVMYHDLGEDVVSSPRPNFAARSSAGLGHDLLEKSVSTLNLSARASNCLEAARVLTIRELVTKTESDLLRVRSFGKTSLHEVQRKLGDIGLSLGMKIAADGSLIPPPPESAENFIDHAEEHDGTHGHQESRSEGHMEVFTMGE